MNETCAKVGKLEVTLSYSISHGNISVSCWSHSPLISFINWIYRQSFIQQSGVERILLSHHHEDHAGNANRILTELPHIPVYASQECSNYLNHGFYMHMYRRVLFGSVKATCSPQVRNTSRGTLCTVRLFSSVGVFERLRKDSMSCITIEIVCTICSSTVSKCVNIVYHSNVTVERCILDIVECVSRVST